VDFVGSALESLLLESNTAFKIPAKRNKKAAPANTGDTAAMPDDDVPEADAPAEQGEVITPSMPDAE